METAERGRDRRDPAGRLSHSGFPVLVLPHRKGGSGARLSLVARLVPSRSCRPHTLHGRPGLFGAGFFGAGLFGARLFTALLFSPQRSGYHPRPFCDAEGATVGSWGRSSVGRATRSQCVGRGFDSLRLHHFQALDDAAIGAFSAALASRQGLLKPIHTAIATGSAGRPMCSAAMKSTPVRTASGSLTQITGAAPISVVRVVRSATCTARASASSSKGFSSVRVPGAMRPCWTRRSAG